MSTPRPCSLALLAALSVVALGGCATVIEVRVQNVSTFAFDDVSIAGQPYGDLGVGEVSDHRPVATTCRYAVLKLKADGRAANAQTLNLFAKRFTYRVDVKNLRARHLAIEVVRD